jgi:hypothetical protein
MSSYIPTASIHTESTVLPAPIATVWAKFRGFKLLAAIARPGFVKSKEGDAAVGSIIQVTYKDGSVWKHQIIELSDKKYAIAYDVVPRLVPASLPVLVWKERLRLKESVMVIKRS